MPLAAMVKREVLLKTQLLTASLDSLTENKEGF